MSAGHDTDPSDGRPGPALWRLAREVAVLCLAGYAVLLAIVVVSLPAPWATRLWFRQGVEGGAFIAFGLAAPSFVLLGGVTMFVQERRRHRRSPPQEEVPPPDEEVPPQPHPHAEQQVPSPAPPAPDAARVPEPRVSEHRPADLPHDERGHQDSPPHGSRDRAGHTGSPSPPRRTARRGERVPGRPVRTDLAARVGTIGWAVLLLVGAGWEALTLLHPSIGTFSSHVRSLMDPVADRVALVAVWAVAGFLLFGPRPTAGGPAR